MDRSVNRNWYAALCLGTLCIVSVVPREALAQSMQAITVPWIPTNPNIPHVTYNGRTIHLKGIVRGGTPVSYKWSYGDPTDNGPGAMQWTAISDPYNLGQTHAYSGMVNQLFIATLQVKDTNGNISTAIYPLEMYTSADTGITIPRNCPANRVYDDSYSQTSGDTESCHSDKVITDPNQMNVRINVAEDEALWYLHVTQSRNTDNSDGDPNGVGTDLGWWADGEAGTCAAMEAFELHGSKPTADYNNDPYVEDVQRTLNYETANLVDEGSVGSYLVPAIVNTGVATVTRPISLESALLRSQPAALPTGPR